MKDQSHSHHVMTCGGHTDTSLAAWGAD